VILPYEAGKSMELNSVIMKIFITVLVANLQSVSDGFKLIEETLELLFLQSKQVLQRIISNVIQRHAEGSPSEVDPVALTRNLLITITLEILEKLRDPNQVKYNVSI
jgi:hypothetical protein